MTPELRWITPVWRTAQFIAVGRGPIDAVQREGLQVELGLRDEYLIAEEYALQSGSNSQAAAYIHLLDAETGRTHIRRECELQYLGVREPFSQRSAGWN